MTREEVCLAGDVRITECLMDAALMLKIGDLLARGTPPTFRKDELHAWPSAAGTVRGALHRPLPDQTMTGWALMPLSTQGAWSLVVVKHGDADHDGFVPS